MSLEVIIKSGLDFELTKFDATTGEIKAIVSSIGNKDVVNDVMVAGAFDEYLKQTEAEDYKLPMLLQHSQTDIIGEWTKFYLRGNNLIGEGEVYRETTAGSDALAFVRRGLVGSTSIGFIASDYEYREDGGRDFKEVKLVEVSLVINPANPKARILSAKSDDGTVSLKNIEKILRESGLTRREATAFTSQGSKALRNLCETELKQNDLLTALKSFKKEK